MKQFVCHALVDNLSGLAYPLKENFRKGNKVLKFILISWSEYGGLLKNKQDTLFPFLTHRMTKSLTLKERLFYLQFQYLLVV
jgi:hypothetical protein